MRIPIRPLASTPDGKVVFGPSVKDRGYGPLIESIQMAKRVNPDIKIFASTKLQGAKTFPQWMHAKEQGRIFRATVQCPDVDKFAGLITDFFERLAAENIKIDFLGLNNEFGGALTPQRYVATARRLVANLEASSIPETFKEFQWVGAEEFGVDGSLRYAKSLAGLGATDYVDLVGSHFYPDKASGSIEVWEKFSKLGVPNWHTEVHVRRHDTPRENIVALRDGMCIVFKTNQQRCEGYIWWDGTSNESYLDNFVRRQMIRSMLYGSCVGTSGRYAAKGNPADQRVAQATRVGDTVWLWCFNPQESIEELPVELTSGQIQSVAAMCFQGGRKVTPQSMPELEVRKSGSNGFQVLQVPRDSIVVTKIQLQDDKELIPMKSWQRVSPRKSNFQGTLTRVTKTTCYFKTKSGKTLKIPAKSLSPTHYPEIKDALKAHGIQ